MADASVLAGNEQIRVQKWVFSEQSHNGHVVESVRMDMTLTMTEWSYC